MSLWGRLDASSNDVHTLGKSEAEDTKLALLLVIMMGILGSSDYDTRNGP